MQASSEGEGMADGWSSHLGYFMLNANLIWVPSLFAMGPEPRIDEGEERRGELREGAFTGSGLGSQSCDSAQRCWSRPLHSQS